MCNKIYHETRSLSEWLMARERLCVCVCVGGSGIQHMGLCFSAFPLVPGPHFPQNSFSYRQWYGLDMDLIKPSGWGTHTEPRCLSASTVYKTAQVTATRTKHLKARSWNASKCHTFLFFLLPLSVLAFPSFFSPAYLDCLFGFFLSFSLTFTFSLSLSLLLW